MCSQFQNMLLCAPSWYVDGDNLNLSDSYYWPKVHILCSPPTLPSLSYRLWLLSPFSAISNIAFYISPHISFLLYSLHLVYLRASLMK